MKNTKYFVEIGSCDFDSLNDLAKEGWKGIVVEPISEYLGNLEKHKGVHYINAAVDVLPGTREMNVFNEDVVENDRDFAGMSSFAEYTHPSNQSNVTSRTVETITYQHAIQSSGIPRVDFLKIDTEGHDLVILNQVIYDGKHRPGIIKAEHKHIQNGAYVIKELLESRGYLVFVERYDVYAIDVLTKPDPLRNHFDYNFNALT